MGRSYSHDLRERVVSAVEKGGLSRREAAACFDVGISTVISWVRRSRETGTVCPGQMGGYKPKKIQGEQTAWLVARIDERAFALRGFGERVGRTRS